jgi:tRNA dimethylallyltransferase
LKPILNKLQPIPLIALIGPTAVGKTALVLELAEELGAEVVSVDSMQVYRRLDIGTAKPTPAEQARVRHHLLDLVEPDQEYNLSRFIEDAERACLEIAARGRLPLLSGGTGLYLRGFQDGIFAADDIDLLSGEDSGTNDNGIRARLKNELAEQGRAILYARLREIDPQAAERIHPHDSSRILRGLEIFMATGKTWTELLARQQAARSQDATRREILKIGLTDRREALYERINRRAAAMLSGGLIEEVEALLVRGYSPELKPLQAIGYRQVIDYLAGRRGYAETLNLLARDTRRYAKRQLTWFGRDPEIHWFRPAEGETIRREIRSYLERKQR